MSQTGTRCCHIHILLVVRMDLSPNMVNDVHKQPGKFDKLQLWMIDDKLTIFIAIRQNCTLLSFIQIWGNDTSLCGGFLRLMYL